MPKVLSRANQECYVAQGLALGLLADGCDEIPADKVSFELAFSGAWRRAPFASRFPVVNAPRSADPYYALLGRSERRKGPVLAAWKPSDRGYRPYLTNDAWTVAESGEMLADWSDVPWPEWQSLAKRLLTALLPPGRS